MSLQDCDSRDLGPLTCSLCLQKDQQIVALREAVEDTDREVGQCWSVLSFDWVTMPEALRIAARDSARDGLYALGTRLRATLKGWNRREVVVPAKTRAELLEATCREKDQQITALKDQVNGFRELAEEMKRVIAAMSSAEREDFLPDWFQPRLSTLLSKETP